MERVKGLGLGGLGTLQDETKGQGLPPERGSSHMYVRLTVLS